MEVNTWRGGRNNNYGIRIGAENRNKYFDRSWTSVAIVMDGRTYDIALAPGFWKKNPEICDPGETGIFREWLQRHKSLDWPVGETPKMQLIPLGPAKFRLTP